MEKNNAPAAVVNFWNVRLMQNILSFLFPVARFFTAPGRGAMSSDAVCKRRDGTLNGDGAKPPPVILRR
jgi:hypothetical protein